MRIRLQPWRRRQLACRLEISNQARRPVAHSQDGCAPYERANSSKIDGDRAEPRGWTVQGDRRGQISGGIQSANVAYAFVDTRRRFGCAGKIDLFIESVSEKFLGDLAARLDARRRCLAVRTFQGRLCRGSW